MIFAFAIILAVMLIKYKPVYIVSISGKEIGYISNKKEFKKLIDSEILNPEKENIAYVDIEEMPEYKMILASKEIQTSEQEIFNTINQNAEVTYKLYAVTINNEDTTYVNSKEEAEETIAKIKEENSSKLQEIEIGMQVIYTKDLEDKQTLETTLAIEVAQTRLVEVINEQEKVKAATLDGVYFSVKPVTGTITSRFGANESIRDHTHMGMDIAAPNGTTIKAAADGKVVHSGWLGGYGNLIIIDHGNGIQTYYGHCSKLYVSEGEEISAGDSIGAVGSTGNSTGNHLHFEIRKNGSQINPQKYLYK